MKKLFALLLIAGCGVAFVGCSPKPADPVKPADTKVEPAPMGDAPAAPAGDAPAAPAAPAGDAPAAPAGDAPAAPAKTGE